MHPHPLTYVYGTCMQVMTVLSTLDDALIRLRRLWQTPSTARVITEPGGSALKMSTVLVTDAIHRLHQTRPATPARVADVADRLEVAPSTASRLVDRAVHAGMVLRGTDATDTRRAMLTLTPAGTALLQRALAFRTDYLEQVLSGWTSTDIETLARLLDRFAAAVHTHGTPTETAI